MSIEIQIFNYVLCYVLRHSMLVFDAWVNHTIFLAVEQSVFRIVEGKCVTVSPSRATLSDKCFEIYIRL